MGVVKGRVLIKMSGSALSKEKGSPFTPEIVKKTVRDLISIRNSVSSLAIVVGGGNFFRGNLAMNWNIDRVEADYLGMLGTVMNALMLKAVIAAEGLQVVVLSAQSMTGFCEQYTVQKAKDYLDQGVIVLLAGGNGQPFVSSDFSVVQRGAELGASQIIFIKRGVDGVYTEDPAINSRARCYRSLSFDSYLKQQLTIFDQTAVLMAKNLNLPIQVVKFGQRKSLLAAINGEDVGTIVGTVDDQFR